MSTTTDIIHTIQGLRAMLDTLQAQVSGEKPAVVSKAPAEPKPKRVASDAVKAWNDYVTQVKADMLASGWTHPETSKPVTRKDAMQEASRRRASDPDAPKPKPKPAKAAESDASDAEAKPKRTLSDEQKAKMAAGRKAAAERRKAEKEVAAVSKPSLVPPPLPESDIELDDNEEESETLVPIAVKAKKYLLNTKTNGCWKRNADSSKGDWAGVYDVETKTIDTSAEEPDA